MLETACNTETRNIDYSRQPHPVKVVGRGTNVNFSIDDSVPFGLAITRLREYLSHCRGLYSSGTVTVNVGRRILAADQMAAIKSILGQETGLTVTRYWCPPEVLARALSGPDSTRALPSPASVRPGKYDCQSDVEARLPCPALPGATARPPRVSDRQARQLSMLFPSLDVEQNVCDAPHALGLQCSGEDNSTPAKGNKELAPTLVDEGSDSRSVDTAGDGELPVNGNPEEEHVAGPVSPVSPGTVSTGSAETEENGEVSPLVVPSVQVPAPNALIIKHTCRSGEVVEYPGDVVVFGDVNPGAEIVAAGDIIVLGALRGMARAGADGNLKATIFALNLESHRLQIGSCVGERPRGAKKVRGDGKAVNPQIAYLRRSSILVAPFERRCDEYHGGIPYDG